MLASGKLILYQDNTQLVRLFGVKDEVTGNYWDTGTIAGTLRDPQGNDVSGFVGITFILQSGSAGNYFGTVGASFQPDVGDGYLLVVDGDQGSSHLHLEIPVEIRARKK